MTRRTHADAQSMNGHSEFPDYAHCPVLSSASVNAPGTRVIPTARRIGRCPDRKHYAA